MNVDTDSSEITQTPVRLANVHNQNVNDTHTQVNDLRNNGRRLITKLKPPQQPKNNATMNGVFEIHVSKFDNEYTENDLIEHIMQNTTIVVAEVFTVEALMSQNQSDERGYKSFKITTLKKQIYDEIMDESLWAPEFTARNFVSEKSSNWPKKSTQNQFTKRNKGNYNKREFPNEKRFETPQPRRHQMQQMQQKQQNNMRRDVLERNARNAQRNRPNRVNTQQGTNRTPQSKQRYSSTPGRNEPRFGPYIPVYVQQQPVYQPTTQFYGEPIQQPQVYQQQQYFQQPVITQPVNIQPVNQKPQ